MLIGYKKRKKEKKEKYKIKAFQDATTILQNKKKEKSKKQFGKPPGYYTKKNKSK